MPTSTDQITGAVNSISDALVKVAGEGVKINITGTLPGEQLLTAIVSLVMNYRETMDKSILSRWDAIAVQQMEDMQKVWRGIWVALGVLK